MADDSTNNPGETTAQRKTEDQKRSTEILNEEEQAAKEHEEAMEQWILVEQEKQAILLEKDLTEDEKKDIRNEILQQDALSVIEIKERINTIEKQHAVAQKQAAEAAIKSDNAPADSNPKQPAAEKVITIPPEPEQRFVIVTPEETQAESDEANIMTKEKALKILLIDDPNADKSTIDSQYRKRYRALHPSRVGDNPVLREEFEQVRKAIAYLRSDPSIPLKNENPATPQNDQQQAFSEARLEAISDTSVSALMNKERALNILGVNDPYANIETIHSAYEERMIKVQQDEVNLDPEAQTNREAIQAARDFLEQDSSVPGVVPLAAVNDTPAPEQNADELYPSMNAID